MTGLKNWLLASAAVLASFDVFAGGEVIVDARYAAPVDRYGHFALGRPHEYADLAATTDTGRTLLFQLPADDVFEDLAPRIVRLAPGEPPEILAIVSRRGGGSRLMLLGLRDGALVPGAQSPAIGTANRWLNPVGVADLDGDGRAEIAAVITPHLGGPLKIYRRSGADLVEIAALEGFSNHVYGTTELALSAPVTIGGRVRLPVPDSTRLFLRIVALEEGRLIELGRCALPAPVTGPVSVTGPARISAGLASGPRTIVLGDCRR